LSTVHCESGTTSAISATIRTIFIETGRCIGNLQVASQTDAAKGIGVHAEQAAIAAGISPRPRLAAAASPRVVADR
jgi:hypothetical protein